VTIPTTYETNRSHIIAVAAELFARNGYHATGIAELGKAVGLGRGALYHYIGSKEEVLYEISREQVDTMNSYAENVLDRGLGAEQAMHEMARGLLRNIADHHPQWSTFFRDYNALTGKRRDTVIAARERYEGYWRQVLDQGAREGILRPTPRLLVKGVLGMLNYTYLWFTPDGEMTPEQLADVFLDALLNGIKIRP
jgi:AcrR family transcriptional regulator